MADASFSASTTRRAIWDDWQQAVALLESTVTVHAAWLGGSFTSAVVDPADIDVTFIVNGDDFRSRTPAEQKVVSVFATANQVKLALGLKVDTYVIAWESVPQPAPPGASGLQDAYYWHRGHWDDWWLRRRVTPKGTPPTSADAPPQRGYLEVPFSDYT